MNIQQEYLSIGTPGCFSLDGESWAFGAFRAVTSNLTRRDEIRNPQRRRFMLNQIDLFISLIQKIIITKNRLPLLPSLNPTKFFFLFNQEISFYFFFHFRIILLLHNYIYLIASVSPRDLHVFKCLKGFIGFVLIIIIVYLIFF